MTEYKVNREELMSLARRMYEDGHGGYMDLIEAAADRAVTEFLRDREAMSSEIVYTTSGNNLVFSDYVIGYNDATLTLPEYQLVRPENFVRTDGYDGNPSEAL